jgi:hypothetical protein
VTYRRKLSSNEELQEVTNSNDLKYLYEARANLPGFEPIIPKFEKGEKIPRIKDYCL